MKQKKENMSFISTLTSMNLTSDEHRSTSINRNFFKSTIFLSPYFLFVFCFFFPVAPKGRVTRFPKSPGAVIWIACLHSWYIGKPVLQN